MRHVAVSCLLALASVPAAAQTAPPSPPAVPPAATAPPKLICHYESVTGSLAARVKRCMTAKQWSDMASNARSMGEAMQNRGFTCGSEVRPC